jgi:hypothetical protein
MLGFPTAGGEGTAIEDLAAEDDAVDLPVGRDRRQGIGSEDEQVGAFTRLDGSGESLHAACAGRSALYALLRYAHSGGIRSPPTQVSLATD